MTKHLRDLCLVRCGRNKALVGIMPLQCLSTCDRVYNFSVMLDSCCALAAGQHFAIMYGMACVREAQVQYLRCVSCWKDDR